MIDPNTAPKLAALLKIGFAAIDYINDVNGVDASNSPG